MKIGLKAGFLEEKGASGICFPADWSVSGGEHGSEMMAKMLGI
jgi:hypothetical protein